MDTIWAFTKLLGSVTHPQGLRSHNEPDYVQEYWKNLDLLTYGINDLDMEPPGEVDTPTSELFSKMCIQLTQVERELEDYVAEMKSEKDMLRGTGKPQAVLLDRMWDTLQVEAAPWEIIYDLLKISFCGALCPASEHSIDHYNNRCPFLKIKFDDPSLPPLHRDSEADDEDYTTCSSELAADLPTKEDVSISDGYITCCSDADAPIQEVVEEDDYQSDTDWSSVEDGDSDESYSGSCTSDTTEVMQRLEEVF